MSKKICRNPHCKNEVIYNRSGLPAAATQIYCCFACLSAVQVRKTPHEGWGEGNCARCEKVFTLKSQNNKYCSKECGAAIHKERYLAERELVDRDYGGIECRNCRHFFKKKHPTQVHCSSECTAATHKAQLKGADKWGYGSCLECKKIFEKTCSSHQYCSKECGQIKFRKARAGSEKKVEEGENRMCWQCLEEFAPTRKGQNFCSTSCTNRASRPRTHYRIFERDYFACGYCGASPVTDKRVELTLDHVHPYSVTENNRVSNIITCCRECNTEKSSRILRRKQEKKILDEVAARNKDWVINPNTTLKFADRRR